MIKVSPRKPLKRRPATNVLLSEHTEVANKVCPRLSDPFSWTLLGIGASSRYLGQPYFTISVLWWPYKKCEGFLYGHQRVGTSMLPYLSGTFLPLRSSSRPLLSEGRPSGNSTQIRLELFPICIPNLALGLSPKICESQLIGNRLRINSLYYRIDSF